jgi:hypothetical protein
MESDLIGPLPHNLRIYVSEYGGQRAFFLMSLAARPGLSVSQALTGAFHRPTRSLIRKLERVFGERVAKDAGNPSGTRHFTISTPLGNDRSEDNQHEYDKTRS